MSTDARVIVAIANLIVRTSRMSVVGVDCVLSLYRLTFLDGILLSDLDSGLLGVTLSDFSCFLTEYSALERAYEALPIEGELSFATVYGRVRDFLMPYCVQLYRPDPLFPPDWTEDWVAEWEPRSGKWQNNFFTDKYMNWYK